MNYTADEISEHFTSQSFNAGKSYQRQGRVRSFAMVDDHISALVQGSHSKPYKQDIVLSRNSRDKLLVEGECSCPMSYNCKHVAAALLEGLKQPGQAAGTPATLQKALQELARHGINVFPSSLTRELLAAPATTRPDELPHNITAWLASLEQAEASLREDYPASVKGRLLYILEAIPAAGKLPRLNLKLQSTRRLKDGTLSTAVGRFNFESAFSNSAATYLRPADMRILRAFKAHNPNYYNTDFHTALASESGTKIIADILATGRAYWQSVSGPPLVQGEPLAAKIVWQPSGTDAMQPALDIADHLVVVQGQPPWYLDQARKQLGVIETGLAPRIAATLLNAPPVLLHHVAQLGVSMAERLPKLAAARPPLAGPTLVLDEPPRPVLRLFSAKMPAADHVESSYYYREPELELVGLARLTFGYGPLDIDHGDARPVLTRVQAGQVYEIHRDEAVEKQVLGLLVSHDLKTASLVRSNVPKLYLRDFLPADGVMGWFDFIYRAVPVLRAQGIDVTIADDFPFQLLRADGDVSADIGEGSGIDWLELSVGVMVEGERIDIVGPLAAIIQAGTYDLQGFGAKAGEDDDPLYLPLGGGRFLALPPSRFLPIVSAIYELASGGTVSDGKLRLNKADAASLGALEEAGLKAGVIWRGGEAIRAMGRKLNAAGGIPPVTLPATFTANLRPYQAQGVAWLSFLRDVGLGGILADDMGLGKTVQALALIAIEKAAGRLDVPALVIAPTSLMANWRREAEKFASDLRVLTLQGSDRKSKFDLIGQHDLVLTTYPLIKRDQEVLAARAWHVLLLDEAQTIKNPDAATTQLIRGLDARHRFCLTGTPLENHLGELWSLFAFASPGFLGERRDFTKNWRNPIEKRGDTARGRILARRVKPFMLRRNKAEVASELPPKTEIIERVDMESAQRDIYESVRLSMHKKIQDAIAAKGFARSRIVILDALLKLRQVCCDPRLLKLTAKSSAKAGSAKLERLEEMLEELVHEGRKIIIFSQFTSMLDLIRPMLDRLKIAYALLTGKTTNREDEINRFRDTATPVFLISLKAGGTGLNLTEADTVILYDPWWNPAVEEQAIDRAHRIGQDKPVFVHKLVVNGTIEEKMEVLKEKKRALAASIFDADGAPTLAMTESDLDMLFAE